MTAEPRKKFLVRFKPDEYARLQRYAQLRGRPVARVTRELALAAIEAEARALALEVAQ